MNTSLSWIKSYVPDLNCTDEEYTDALTLSGTKVEGALRLDKNLEKIVVAQIISIQKHPDADKLLVCQCDIGTEQIQIVTGASNISVGDKVPVVLDGGKVAGGHKGERPEEGIRIHKGQLRGVDSFGMMCSIDELGADKNLYPDAPEKGIYILPEDSATGSDAIALLGLRDTVFEYEVTSNRVDCFGVLGIAREAAATFRKKFVPPVIKECGNAENAADYLQVEIKDTELCRRYCARLVKNVKLAPSPAWMQKRLAASGIRPINNIVDITNYVMLEYGQPMHAFDYALIEGAKIIVDRAQDGAVFQTLDGQERQVDSSVLMINDSKKALAIAGIMGGENSKITEDVQTMVFESATFEGTNIRLSSKKIGLRTDSSAKFEKGLDPENAMAALNRACQLVEELGAGEVLGGVVDVYPTPPVRKSIPFKPERINGLLGTDISEEEMLSMLAAVEIFLDKNTQELIIPTFRQDLAYMADIAEEVARFYGYDKIPTTLPQGQSTMGGRSFTQELEQKAGEVARFYGFSQAMSYSFESPKVFSKLLLPKDSTLRSAIEISNPLGEDFSIMRTLPLNGILQSLSVNYNRRNKAVRLYELANIYLPESLPLQKLPEERKQFTLAFYEDGDFFDMKGVAEEFFAALHIPQKPEYRAGEELPFLHPGRKAGIYMQDVRVGYLGQLHPEVAQAYKLCENTYIAVLDLPALYPLCNEDIKYSGIARYPGISRDISLVVPTDVTAAQIEACIAAKGTAILESYALFDIYEGNQMKSGTKSMAYKIHFRHKERTLEDKEVAQIMEDIIKELEKTGVYLRA